MPKRVKRTFTACWTCRKRHVRCDGKMPTCGPCARQSLDCEGDRIQLSWVDAETGRYTARLRRILGPELTWLDHHTYSARQLEHLLEENRKDCHCELHMSPKTPFRLILIESGYFTSVRPSINQLAGRHTQDQVLFSHYVCHVAFLLTPIDDDRNPWKSVYPAMALGSQSPACKSLYHGLLSQAAFNLAKLRRGDYDSFARYRHEGLSPMEYR
uniref:Zn(2)-C6 fungal-type domain-containing protein n=1 Tax=Bionectria ochroleuca TaxID=29856 RepID=A0A0B7K536_BIOOC